MEYKVTHKTEYIYSSSASLSQNETVLVPRNTDNQRVDFYRLRITPTPDYQHRRIDYFGNMVDFFMVQSLHDVLSLCCVSKVQTLPVLLPDAESSMAWEDAAWRFRGNQMSPADLEAVQFSFSSSKAPRSENTLEWGRLSFPPGRPLLSGAMDLMSRIFREFTYDKAASDVNTSVEEVLEKRGGVCQDFAHLGISCLRSLGLAARYVSGYLETTPPPGSPKLVGADASHAWFSVYLPDYGWVDLDPTNNQPANESYVTVAWGRDYSDVAPVKGVVLGGGIHKLSVMVDVERISL